MSLSDPYDPNNIFAKILRGDASCVKVFEDDDVLSFMDIFPQSPGHALVIPKCEARNIFDISAEGLAVLMQRTQMIAAAIRRALNPDGVFIGQFNGAEAGQTVFHLHFHVIPRVAGKPYQGHGDAAMADQDALRAMAEKIQAAL